MTKFEQLENFKGDSKKLEQLAEDMLKSCPLSEKIKRIFIENLILNFKFNEAINFINTKISEDERSVTDEYDYLTALTYYHDGQYEKSKKILRVLLSKNSSDQRYRKMFQILEVIENEKEKANHIFKTGNFEKAYDAYTKLLELDPENKNFCSIILANRALCMYYS